MTFIAVILIALTGAFAAPAWASLPPTDVQEWIQTNQKDGISVFKREVPGSSLLAFRGEAIVDAPIEKVATVIFDTTRAPEWMVDLKESRLVRWVSENEFVEYDHIGTPPVIMKDRDFVSLVKMKVDTKFKQMTFTYRSIEDPELPEGRHVRGDLKNTTFKLMAIDGGSRTRLEGEIHCDPKGGVPKWLVNFFQESWPVDTIKNLRKQLAKPDVQVDPKFAKLFGGIDKSKL